MLATPTMSRTAVALLLVAASASAASAGGFVGLGIGTSPATSGDLNLREDGRSVRLQIGYRFGRLSVEGFGAKADLRRNDGAPMNWTTLAVAGRLNIPLGDQFEAFGRLGLQHSSVEQDQVDNSFDGDGYLVGGGFEYRIPSAAIGASIFVDYTIEHANLTSPQRSSDLEFDLTSRVWTLGGIIAF
jgi:hypothetical protein